MVANPHQRSACTWLYENLIVQEVLKDSYFYWFDQKVSLPLKARLAKFIAIKHLTTSLDRCQKRTNQINKKIRKYDDLRLYGH